MTNAFIIYLQKLKDKYLKKQNEQQREQSRKFTHINED